MLFFDRIPADHLMWRQQHGFLAKHSTCTQLLEAINDWSVALSNSNVVDIVYFDIAKAFDTLSHVKLLHKLQAYGFHGRLLSIFAAFLGGRFQRVMLPGGSSCLLYTSPSPRDGLLSRMPSSA